MNELNKVINQIRNNIHISGFFKLDELKQIGVSETTIKTLIDNNEISQCKDDIYFFNKHFYDIETLIQTKIPEGVFCFENAAVWNDLTDKNFIKYFILINENTNLQEIKKRFNNQELKGMKINFIKQPKEIFELGQIEYSNYVSKTLKITNREKTLCDCILYKDYIEKEMFWQTIYNYFFDAYKLKNIPKLLECAKIMNLTKEIAFCIENWEDEDNVMGFFYGW